VCLSGYHAVIIATTKDLSQFTHLFLCFQQAKSHPSHRLFRPKGRFQLSICSFEQLPIVNFELEDRRFSPHLVASRAWSLLSKPKASLSSQKSVIPNSFLMWVANSDFENSLINLKVLISDLFKLIVRSPFIEFQVFLPDPSA
jgi:hypothetical protein